MLLKILYLPESVKFKAKLGLGLFFGVCSCQKQHPWRAQYLVCLFRKLQVWKRAVLRGRLQIMGAFCPSRFFCCPCGSSFSHPWGLLAAALLCRNGSPWACWAGSVSELRLVVMCWDGLLWLMVQLQRRTHPFHALAWHCHKPSSDLSWSVVGPHLSCLGDLIYCHLTPC